MRACKTSRIVGENLCEPSRVASDFSEHPRGRNRILYACTRSRYRIHRFFFPSWDLGSTSVCATSGLLYGDFFMFLCFSCERSINWFSKKNYTISVKFLCTKGAHKQFQETTDFTFRTNCFFTVYINHQGSNVHSPLKTEFLKMVF